MQTRKVLKMFNKSRVSEALIACKFIQSSSSWSNTVFIYNIPRCTHAVRISMFNADGIDAVCRQVLAAAWHSRYLDKKQKAHVVALATQIYETFNKIPIGGPSLAGDSTDYINK